MIVIKATLREETRRLTFDSHGFPPYDEVQEKVSSMSNWAGWQLRWQSCRRLGGNDDGRSGGRIHFLYLYMR